jgi:hypothetical protein
MPQISNVRVSVELEDGLLVISFEEAVCIIFSLLVDGTALA